MICNLCGVNEATIHLTEIVNNQMIEIHLCESCAQEKGTDFKTHFNFGELLGALPDLGKTEDLAGEKRAAAVKCSQCQMTYEEFGKTGRLGCPECYTSFSKMLLPLIRRVQRSTQHTGKRPAKQPKPTRASGDLKLLQDRLRKSILNEAFEEAARIRDEIRVFEENSKKSKKAKEDKA